MRIKPRARPWAVLTWAVAAALLLAGCGESRPDIRFPSGSMLHLQQVLERYDADGEAVPQYLELWLTQDKGRCSELDKDGREIAVALDSGREHLYWDAATLEGERSGESRLFVISLSSMKKLYPTLRVQNDGIYAGRDCDLYQLDTGNTEQWVKLYVDKATGYVLLCDAETFRLRTKLIEAVPADEKLFSAPEGITIKAGEGK